MQVSGGGNRFLQGPNRFQQASAAPPTDPAKGLEKADNAAKAGGGDGQKEQILGKIFESLGQKVAAPAEQRSTLEPRRLDMKA